MLYIGTYTAANKNTAAMKTAGALYFGNVTLIVGVSFWHSLLDTLAE